MAEIYSKIAARTVHEVTDSTVADVRKVVGGLFGANGAAKPSQPVVPKQEKQKPSGGFCC
ncbi:MAG: hypothetical protein NTU49_08480 [Gammaproteobacteria bacterium]|nr:hypothetical protein [Gammaproteobacteria bacterium]